MVKPTSCRDLKELKADEKKASQDYADRGYAELSHDEAKHYRFLTREEKIKNCK